jgi:hypothetical protein
MGDQVFVRYLVVDNTGVLLSPDSGLGIGGRGLRTHRVQFFRKVFKINKEIYKILYISLFLFYICSVQLWHRTLLRVFFMFAFIQYAIS